MFGVEPQIAWMLIVFIVGYIALVFDQYFKIPRTIVSLWVAIICWFLLLSSNLYTQEETLHSLTMHMVIIAQVSFFQLGATSILGIANTHRGFRAIAQYFPTNSKRILMLKWSIIAFLLSSVFNNVLSATLMLRVMKERIVDHEDQRLFGAAIVLAANSGGSWTPIGDLTTNVLWVGGQISSLSLIMDNWLPALTSFLVPLFFLMRSVRGEAPFGHLSVSAYADTTGKGAFILAVVIMCFVPVFKWFAGFPPFLCTLFGLSIVWLVCEQFLYKETENRSDLQKGTSLTSVDLAVPLYILSILLSVKALETAGFLQLFENFIHPYTETVLKKGLFLGLLSTFVDNVPVATAATGMFSLEQFPMDDPLWHMVILCVGTGGSILGIGSVAGLAYIREVEVGPGWWIKNISWMALLGFLSGLSVFLLRNGYFA